MMKFLGAIVFACTFAGVSHATVYNVSDTVGAGNVTGSITTDGTLGVLGAANITDWNLLLNDGTLTFDLLGPASGNNSNLLLAGSSFTATTGGLFFNFGSSDGSYVDIKNPTSGPALNYLCLQDSKGQCSSDASDLVLKVDPDGEAVSREPGNVEVAVAAPTPEPASLGLLGAGLVGFGLFRRLRSR